MRRITALIQGFKYYFFFLTQEAQKEKVTQKEKRAKEGFASAEATADPGGTDKPLKRLERNFQMGIAHLCG